MATTTGDPNSLHRELSAFTACLQMIHSMAATIELRPDDRKSLVEAIKVIEAAIDEELQRLLGKKHAHFIAKGLKETQIAMLRQRYKLIRNKSRK